MLSECTFLSPCHWPTHSCCSHLPRPLKVSVTKVHLPRTAKVFALHDVHRRSARPVLEQKEQVHETSRQDIVSAEDAPSVSAEKLASRPSRLPWAVEPSSVNRRLSPKVIDSEKDGSLGGVKQETTKAGGAQLSTVRLAPQLSARQQLLALDRERGEETPATSPTPTEKVRRNASRVVLKHVRVGAKQDWENEARLARRAVEAILSSQGLVNRSGTMTAVAIGSAGTMTAVNDGSDYAMKAATQDAPGEGRGVQLWRNGRELGSKPTSNRSSTAVESRSLARFLNGTLKPLFDPGGVLEGESSSQAVNEDTSPAANDSGANTKKAALVRVLEPLAGSLSLFRWQEVLKDLGERGHWAVALGVFKWTQANLRIKPNAFTYAQMAMTLQAAGQTAPIIDLYNDALRNGINPLPVPLFNAVIFAHVQQGNLSKGLEVLEAMEAAGCKAGQWTYTYLLQGCAPVETSEPGSGLDLDGDIGFEGESGMEPEGLDGSDVSLGLELDGDLGFAAIAGLRREGMVGAENGLPVSVSEAGSRLERGATAGKEFRLEGTGLAVSLAEPNSQSAVEIADGLVRRMLASGVHHNLVTLNALVKVYATAGHVAKAREVFNTFSSHGVKADAGSYLNLFHACVRGGAPLADLLEVYRGMVQGGSYPPPTMYHPLLLRCAREKNLLVACELFSEMRSLGITPGARLYTSLVLVCGTVGDIPRAEGVLTEMLTQGLKVTAVTWNALLSGMRKGGAGFAQMKPVVKRMRDGGTPLDCTTYSLLLRACKAEGLVNTAQKVYVAFRSDDSVLGDRVQVYQEALELFSRGVMVDECETVTEHMLSEGLGFTQRAHEALVAAYAAELNYPAMAEVLAAMLDEELTPGVVANEHLARALARGGRTEDLLLLLKTIRESGGRVPGRMWHYVIKTYVNRPEEDSTADEGASEYSKMSETLLELHRTSAPLPTAALGSLLAVVSQADTWRTIEPLIALLGQIDSPLFQAAFEVLSPEPNCVRDEKSDVRDRRMETKVTGLEPAETEPTEMESAETESKGTESAKTEPAETESIQTEKPEMEPAEPEPAEAMVSGLLSSGKKAGGKSSSARPATWAVDVAERFVRVARETESEDFDLRRSLLGRMADALWFRGLRGRALSLVRATFTLELNVTPDGRPKTSHVSERSEQAKPGDVLDDSGRPGRSHVSDPWRVDLHNLSDGGACALLMSWLSFRQRDVRQHLRDPPETTVIITGWGKHRVVGDRQAGVSTVRAVVGGILKEMGSPFAADASNEGVLTASGESVRKWLEGCPKISLVDERV